MAVLGLLIAGIVYKLPPADIKEVLLSLIQSPTFAALGWLLCGVQFLVTKWVFDWKDRIHQQEINRIAEQKKIAQQAHYKKPLLGSESP